jgi:hypothetical protein
MTDDEQCGAVSGIIGRGNQERTCPSVAMSTTNPTLPHLGSNPSCRNGKPASNCLSLNMAKMFSSWVTASKKGLVILELCSYNMFQQGHMVALVVEALCCKLEDRRFESRWGHWIFFNWYNPSSRTMALWFDSVSNRNEYYKMFVGTKSHPAHKADNLTAISEPVL